MTGFEPTTPEPKLDDGPFALYHDMLVTPKSLVTCGLAANASSKTAVTYGSWRLLRAKQDLV